MRLSASSLKEYTKCGYHFYLQRMKEVPEPGKRNYGMLQGRVMDRATSNASIELHREKELPDEVLSQILADSYVTEFKQAHVPSEVGEAIRDLLVNGCDPGLMMDLHALSSAINTTEFEIKIPGLLKSGELSKDVKKPSLGVIVQNAEQNLQWFFSQRNIHSQKIKDADTVEHQVHFIMDLDNGVEVDGYYDQMLRFDDRGVLSEFKSDKTPYSQTFVDKMIQVVTYQMSDPSAQVILTDLSHEKWYEARPSKEMIELTKRRYMDMANALRAQVYIPACGTDPYNDKRILCGYKCSTACPYGDAGSDEYEEAA